MLVERFEKILEEIRRACSSAYSERMVSLAVFGSVARGTVRPDSDIDLLLVVNDLPRGRIARIREFDAVKALVAPSLR